MSTMQITTAAALAVVFAVATASAQQPATQRVAGTLDKVEGNTLYIKAASGPVILKLPDNALVVARIKASAADIKAGDYVANTGPPRDCSVWYLLFRVATPRADVTGGIGALRQ